MKWINSNHPYLQRSMGEMWPDRQDNCSLVAVEVAEAVDSRCEVAVELAV